MQVIAIDFETDLISAQSPIPAPVCLSWATSDSTGLEVGMDKMANFLVRAFNGETRIVAHNLKFELLVIYTHFPGLRQQLWEYLENVKYPQVYCTMLFEVLLSNISKKETLQYGLADLVQKYFKTDISSDKTGEDAWRLRYSELRGVSLENWPEAAVKYAIDDSVWALKVYHAQKELGKPLKLVEHVQADFTLNLMAATGMTVDHARVQQLEDELKASVADDIQLLKEGGFITTKMNGEIVKNVKVFREYIANNYKNLEYTKSKQISVAGESLQKYILEDPKDVLVSFLNVVSKEKVQTAFVERLKEADPLIRTSYEAIKRSGRTSSRTTKTYPSVNIQQMPRKVEGVTYDIRACFIPREGFELVSIDYSGLELSATANQLQRVFGRSAMADTINSGQEPVDMHSKLACKIASIKQKRFISYEEFMQNKKSPENKHFRQMAKPINLGFPGGIGYDTMRHLMYKEGVQTKYEVLESFPSETRASHIAYNLKQKYPNIRVARTGFKEWSIVYDELVGFKTALFSLYPELGQFLRHEHEKYQTSEFVAMKNEWGEWESEKAYAFDTSGVRRDFCTYTAFCNGYLMQTPAAAGAKSAVYHIVKEFYEDADMNPLAFIHDEIIFEVRANSTRKFEIIDRVAELMITSMQRALPHVRIAVEASLMDYWTKSGGKWEAQYWINAKESTLNKREI